MASKLARCKPRREPLTLVIETTLYLKQCFLKEEIDSYLKHLFRR